MLHESGATQDAFDTAHDVASLLSRFTGFTEGHNVETHQDGAVTITMFPADQEGFVIIAQVSAEGVLLRLSSREIATGETEDLRGGDLWEECVIERIPVAD